MRYETEVSGTNGGIVQETSRDGRLLSLGERATALFRAWSRSLWGAGAVGGAASVLEPEGWAGLGWEAQCHKLS